MLSKKLKYFSLNSFAPMNFIIYSSKFYVFIL
nr:MAG TPA: hypothetical protein [Caudoviricetes sp.]